MMDRIREAAGRDQWVTIVSAAMKLRGRNKWDRWRTEYLSCFSGRTRLHEVSIFVWVWNRGFFILKKELKLLMSESKVSGETFRAKQDVARQQFVTLYNDELSLMYSRFLIV